MCIHEGCKVRPSYNNEDEKTPIYCVTHKLKGMVNIKDKTCIHECCKVRPYYKYDK